METVMNPIFPVSALQKNQREVKNAAANNVVRITENGVGAYVFCTEKMFAKALEEAREEGAYEARMHAVIERGRADVIAGRVYRGTEAARGELERRLENG